MNTQTCTEKFFQIKADSANLSRDWLNNCDEPTLKALFSDYQITVEQERCMVSAAGGVERLVEILANEKSR